MDNNMKNFMKKLADSQKYNFQVFLLFVSIAALMVLQFLKVEVSGEVVFEGNQGFSYLSVLGAFGLSFLLPIGFIMKYSYIGEGNEELGRGIESGEVPCEVFKFARFNRFDADAYWRLLFLRYLPLYLIGIAINVAVVLSNAHMVNIVMMAISVICPGIVFGVSKAMFIKDTQNEQKTIVAVVRGMLYGIITMLNNVIAAISIMFLCFIGCAKIIDYLALSKYGPDDVYIVSYSTITVILMGAAIVILALSLLYSKQLMIKKLNVRLMGVILSVILFGAAIGLTVVEKREIGEDSFTVHRLGSVKQYSIDDVKSYEITEDSSNLKLKLFFKDDESISVFGQISTYTEAYGDKYNGDAEFTLELAKKLKAMGAEGKFDEEARSKLKGSYAKYDEELIDALEELCSLHVPDSVMEDIQKKQP